MASLAHSLEGINELSAKFTVNNNQYIIEVVVMDEVAYLPTMFESVNMIEHGNNGVVTSHRDTGVAKWPVGFRKLTKGEVYRMTIDGNQKINPTVINLWAGLRDPGGKLMSVETKKALVGNGEKIYESIRALQ